MRAGIGIHVVVAAVILALPAVAAEEASVEKYVELLRKDVQTEKVLILTEALDLPDAEAQKFWPVYRKYEAALAEIGDRRLMLIKKFADTEGVLDVIRPRQFADLGLPDPNENPEAPHLVLTTGPGYSATMVRR